MRKLLLLLCILSITISTKAQLFGKHWDEGSYYDLQGVKHQGLISWTAPQKSLFNGDGDEIFYKTQKDADMVKIKSSELRSFIIGVDSFVVSKNEIFKRKPFLNVLVNTNDTLKIYRSMEKRSSPGIGFGVGSIGAVTAMVGASFNYTKKAYYYGKNPNNVIKIDNKNFTEVTSKILANIPLIVKEIESKSLRDMEDVEVALQQWAYSQKKAAQAADNQK
ncbi:hypothetical protein FPZ42_08390 [Mucilaginibacter achroorhodeus]|uniref:DUF4136 domain-containing protein n=1 Tax=Mucilaginibacter achroorhodeus TaxID=2599294 RepID=A0A563U6R2_9SPHI|nr:hypothetical protein [Mucilaginibacter achroorhodeus]TWR27041.1 hypothetical protein FPZ42_08390 [Mucilaginibacter achroorhodeus]